MSRRRNILRLELAVRHSKLIVEASRPGEDLIIQASTSEQRTTNQKEMKTTRYHGLKSVKACAVFLSRCGREYSYMNKLDRRRPPNCHFNEAAKIKAIDPFVALPRGFPCWWRRVREGRKQVSIGPIVC